MAEHTSRFVRLYAPDGGAPSQLMLQLARERGWLVDASGHVLMPRLADPDLAWRRFALLLPFLTQKRRLDASEIAAIVNYRGAVTQVRAHMPRKVQKAAPKPTPDEVIAKRRAEQQRRAERAEQAEQRRQAAKEKTDKTKRAVDLCVQMGFSRSEAAEATGVSVATITTHLKAMRDRGESLGLAEIAKARSRSVGQANRWRETREKNN